MYYLFKQIIEIINTKTKSLSNKASKLLTWILKFSAQKLPRDYAEKVHSLNALFSMASNFENESLRLFARDQFAQLVDSVLHPEDPVPVKFTSLAVERHAKLFFTRDYTPSDTIRTRIAYHLDDVTFRNLVGSSEVLGIKDYSKWNWDAIYDIISGPLLNPKRFEELLKNKFLGKIISYLRPSSQQFINVPFKEAQYKLRMTICLFFKTLLGSQEGLKFLGESKIISEIGECLGQLVDPVFLLFK